METKIKRLDLNLVFLLVDYIKMVGMIGFELVSPGLYYGFTDLYLSIFY